MKSPALTPEEKWALCQRKARRIVRNHRKLIPRGHEYWNTWVAVGVAVVGATVSAVQAHKQAQAQKQAAAQQAQAAQDNQLPEFKPPPMPKYVPFDFAGVNKQAIDEDRAAYARSDRDFAARHPGVLGAEKIFEGSVLKDQQGDSELMPEVQNQFLRAGIQSALQSFGANGANLEPGSAGEANVARNLGIDILKLQDRNRQNRQQSLQLAEGIFPRREFGMNGKDFALTALQDAVNQNQFNQANYAAETGAYEKNYDINAQNRNTITQSNNALAEANAQAKAAQTQAYTNAAMSVIGAGAQAYGAGGGSAGSYSNVTVPGVSSANVEGFHPYSAQNPNWRAQYTTKAWAPVGAYA